MRTPRQLLVLFAVAMTIVGVETFEYPPSYLTFAWLWATLALVAGAVCAWTAVRPRRFLVSLSGSILVTISAGRAIAIVLEILGRNFPGGETGASFLIAATIWTLVSVLSFVVWREYVLPWSIGLR